MYEFFNLGHPQLIYDGNSLSTKDGTNANGRFRMPLTSSGVLVSVGKIFAHQAYPVSGKSTTALIADFPTKIAPYIRPYDIVVMWEITNDIKIYSLTGQQAYDNVVTYCNLVKAAGGRSVVVTMIARDFAGDEADLWTRGQDCNTLLRDNWQSFAYACADPALDTNFDSKADCSNTTYYLSDKIHLTDAGYDLVAQYVSTAVSPLL